MAHDHLDNEISVAVEITQAGVKAKAESRLVSAVDRLCGNLFKFLNNPVERRNVRDRALIEGEKKVIGSLVDLGIDRIKIDPEFAQRAAEKHLLRLFDVNPARME